MVDGRCPWIAWRATSCSPAAADRSGDLSGDAVTPPADGTSRVALVLGAGGMAGLAFHAGVLSALAEAVGWDSRAADLIVGTSAGSITATGLRAGVSAADLFARTCGHPLSPEGAAVLAPADAAVDGGPRAEGAGRLAPRPAAPGLLLAGARRPGRVRPGALAAALLPAGRIPTTAISAGVGALFPTGWPERPTWVCAVSLDDGQLTVFGRPGAPVARVGPAVAASCAIPGYFAPVEIDGIRYVDGGAHSTVNLAELRDEHFDLVVVSAPMARAGARPPLVPPGLPAAIGAVSRELNRFQLGLEARALRSRGTAVVAFSPTVEDRMAMGLNPMDASRRAPIARQARESALRRLERPEVRQRLALLQELGV
jgi:NTE family protein